MKRQVHRRITICFYQKAKKRQQIKELLASPAMMNPSTPFHRQSSTADSVHVINDEDDNTTTTLTTTIATTAAPRTTGTSMFGYQEILEACRSFYNPPSEQMILPFKRLPPRIEDAVEMIEEHRQRQKRQKTGEQVRPCSASGSRRTIVGRLLLNRFVPTLTLTDAPTR